MLKTKRLRKEKVDGWHFLLEDGRLRYGDNRFVKVGDRLQYKTFGDNYKTFGDNDKGPILCEIGMHASIRLVDALEYAPGPLLCRVTIEKDISSDRTKIVGRYRTALSKRSFVKGLKKFIIDCYWRLATSGPKRKIAKVVETFLTTGEVMALPLAGGQVLTLAKELIGLDNDDRYIHRMAADVMHLAEGGFNETRSWSNQKLMKYAKEAGFVIPSKAKLEPSAARMG